MYNVAFKDTDKNQILPGSHITVPDVQLIYPACRQHILPIVKHNFKENLKFGQLSCKRIRLLSVCTHA